MICTTGCISTETLSAAEIKANALQFVEGIDSYNFSISGKMEMTITNDIIGTENSSRSFSGNGMVDISNEELMVEMQVNSSEQQSIMETIIYILDGIMYTKTSVSDEDTWTKQNVTNNAWNSYDYIELQKQLLEASNVEKLDDKTIDGVECYVLKIQPDLEKLFGIMLNQQGTDIPAPPDLENLSEIMEDWKIKQWIAKDTNYMKKIYNQMVITYSIFNQNVYIYMDIEILFSDYNQEFALELPEEAENTF